MSVRGQSVSAQFRAIAVAQLARGGRVGRGANQNALVGHEAAGDDAEAPVQVSFCSAKAIQRL